MHKAAIIFGALVISALVIGALGVIAGLNLNQRLINIYTAPKNDPNLVQWKKDWTKAGNSLVSGDVVSSN